MNSYTQKEPLLYQVPDRDNYAVEPDGTEYNVENGMEAQSRY